MKKLAPVLFFIMIFLLVGASSARAQCSICTKTAGQLGEKRAQGLNTGIIYLMLAPFAIVGFIGFRWWQGQKNNP